MSADESLTRVEALLARAEAVRQKLDQSEDRDTTIEVLEELRELAREVDAEIQRAEKAAEADAADA